jgi:hypothetical protein
MNRNPTTIGLVTIIGSPARAAHEAGRSCFYGRTKSHHLTSGC